MFFTKSLLLYTQELNGPEYDPLSKEREVELVKQLADGSEEARQIIIKAHLRFVVYLLRGFKIPPSVETMDLIQEGNLGLIDGIQRFNLAQFDVRVSTYVQYYIRFYIARALGLYNKSTVLWDLPDNFNFDDVESDSQVEEHVHLDILSFIKQFLDTRELKIISLLFGLEPPYKPITLKEVGSLLHLNSEWIRQIRNDALEKIKEHQIKLQQIR